MRTTVLSMLADVEKRYLSIIRKPVLERVSIDLIDHGRVRHMIPAKGTSGSRFENIQKTASLSRIGRWIDADGYGNYNVLEAETRGFKGPRVYDATGLPLHFDNQSIFKERIYLDRADPNTIHDEVTVVDHALTRPWTVDKRYVHDPNPRPQWREGNCEEGSGLVALGKEMYVLRADGLLMPARDDQPPPDLRYFKKGAK